jgi:membrane fusion protein (multidrug efflux system)
VEVALIRTITIKPALTLQGDVEAFSEGEVHTEVEGLVEDTAFKEGDFVDGGQTLIVLNSSQLELDLRQTEEEREAGRVRLEKEWKEYERFRELSESSSVSPLQLEKEWADAESAKFQLRKLDALIDRLKDRLEKKTIRAPHDGYIVRERVYRGMWAQPGAPICRMVRVDPIFVRVAFPQKKLSEIRLGDEAAVKVEGVAGKLKGRVSAILALGDLSSRTFPVKIMLPNRSHRLLPGMLAHVTFRLGKAREALVAPKDSVIVTTSQRKIIYVVEDGKAGLRPVRIGQKAGALVEIKGRGLKEGQLVVTVGNERLRPGQAVKIIGGGDAKPRKADSPPKKKPAH